MSALKRVEAVVAHAYHFGRRDLYDSVSSCCGTTLLTASDLRAVLTLAKQAGDLKRRVRLARPKLSVAEREDLEGYVRYYIEERRVKGEWWRVATAVRSLLKSVDLLDLRKPLHRRRR